MANLKLGVTIGGNVAIHSGNYNSYAPTLTGGNASGTWAISISGNSATTSQTNFSSLTIGGAAVATQAYVTSQGYLTSYTETDPYRVTAAAVTGTTTKTLTLTRADSSTVTATWTDYDSDSNTFVNAASFNTGNGVLTLTRNDGGTVTVDLDDRYALAGSYLTAESDTLATVTNRGNVATGDIYVPSGAKFRARYDGTNNYHSSLDWYGLQLGNNGANYIIAGRTNAGGKLMFYTNNTSDFTSINGAFAATMHASGRTSFGQDSDNGYQVQVYGSLYSSDWIRVAGTSGLYFESYGGGWRMTDSTWIRAYNDKSIYTGGSIEAGGWVGGSSSQTRDKLRVWSSDQYSIGMKAGYDYGHLGNDEYAMSFQMNDNSGRGFWWGDTGHSDDQGAASLTTDGRMVIAKSLSIGEGESIISPSSTPLYVKGSTSGADVFAVDGINGRLFTVNDDLSDSLFSVNTIAGLPVIEAFADNVVKIGKYGYATTWSSTGSVTMPNSATIYRDLIVNGGTSNPYGNRIIVGSDSTPYTLQDSNLRPTIYASGAYPVLTLNQTVNNSSHGPTIQFAHNTNNKQWVIGTNGTGTRLDIGYSTSTDRNPHNGIDDHSGSTFMRINSSGSIELGRGNGRSVRVDDTLYVGASDSGDAHMYFGEDSSNWYGLHWYWDSGYTVYLYGRNAGTDTEIMRYTTNSNTYVEWRRHFNMNNYEVNYVGQLHFNSNTRFVNSSANYLYLQLGSDSYGSIQVRDNSNSLRGYLGYFDANGFGLLNSSGNWGIRLNPGNAETLLYYAGGVKLTTLSEGTRIYGNLHLDDNYGYGVVGVYSDTRYQGVFAMGNAYKLAADGTGTGTLYGIAWTHSNIGGESKAGLGHQALFMMNGRTYTAIGSGIWTDGTITTTSHGTSANWNTAYGWGNHASAGYLTSLPSHTHDDRYYTETESDARFAAASHSHAYIPQSGDTLIEGNYFYFRSNRGDYLGSLDSPSLQVYATGTNSAFMSFHRGGSYAVNFGLDRDNVMRIGGWSAAADRWVLDMSGNNTVASSFRAPIFYDSQDTGYYLDPNSLSNLYHTKIARLQGGKTAFNTLEISPGGTPAFIKIRTTIPFSYGSGAWSVYVKGFVYGSSRTLDLHISWHTDGSNNAFYSTAMTSRGSFTPRVRLAREGGNVVIVMTWNNYWPKLYVEAYNAFANDYYFGWDWVDEDVSGDKVSEPGVLYPGNFSDGNISNWNTAYGWGNHASAGYLTSLPSHNHDDRYYTESESDSRFAAASHSHSYVAINGTDRVGVLRFYGEGGDSGHTSTDYPYGIFQERGAWSNPYPDLRINFHTGIVLAANATYGGIRFQRDFNDTTELMSVGNGDNHVRVASNLYMGGNLVATQAWVSANFNNYSLPFSYGTGVTANYVVQRDANGYIYANHINFNTSETENPTIGSFFVSNGDGWSRKASIAHVRNQLGNYGGWLSANGDTGNGAYTFNGEFTINGNLTVNGVITENSSIRYKTNIQPITDALSRVLDLQGVSYLKIGSTQTEIGLIAEEVAKIIPEAVSFDSDGQPDSIAYQRLVSVLIEAVKDLNAKVEKLSDQLNGN